MLLTRDNLLRFVREKKYVTPTTVAEPFETSTMIASAALGELTKDKQLAVTNFKLGTSPYYYDPRQKEALVEIGEKHFSKLDKDIFVKLQSQQLLNDKALTVQEKLAIGRIKDFAIPLEIEHGGNALLFWVWYMRDLNETRSQIVDALNGTQREVQEKKQRREEIKAEIKKETSSPKQEHVKKFQEKKTEIKPEKISNVFDKFEEETPEVKKVEKRQVQEKEEKSISTEHMAFSKDKEEVFIEKFLDENYLNIENKQKHDHGISYTCILRVRKLDLLIDCFYFYKKPTEGDIIKFYTSSMRPKVAFIINAPKKLFKLAESMDNFEVVNI